MMASSYQYSPYIWPMVTAIGLTAAVGIYSWRHRSVPGAAGTRMRPLGMQPSERPIERRALRL